MQSEMEKGLALRAGSVGLESEAGLVAVRAMG